MKNIYADIDEDLSKVLHGAARLHVALGRMDGVGISTRGWSYNDLVDGILKLNCSEYSDVRQMRCIDTLFDTLDAIVEIGASSVTYLHDLRKIK